MHEYDGAPCDPRSDTGADLKHPDLCLFLSESFLCSVLFFFYRCNRWLGHCNYGFPSTERSPADATATAATTLSSSTPAVVEAEQEKAMMEGVFEDASRHLRAAEAGSGDDRWQG